VTKAGNFQIEIVRLIEPVRDILIVRQIYFTMMEAENAIRVPGCRHRGPGFHSRRYRIFCIAVGLERDPFNFVRITEELLERKVAAPV
jgi:hypothetical protein